MILDRLLDFCLVALFLCFLRLFRFQLCLASFYPETAGQSVQVQIVMPVVIGSSNISHKSYSNEKRLSLVFYILYKGIEL